MMRSAMNIASVFLFGAAFSTMVMMLGFFASPQAVRTSPPASYSALLLQQFNTPTEASRFAQQR